LHKKVLSDSVIEEIQEEAIKCGFCGEWLEEIETVKAEALEPEAPAFHGERVLCPDGTCKGVIGADGVCSECGRKPEAVETETDHDDSPKLYETIKNRYVKPFRKLFWLAIAIWTIIWILSWVL
jgi:hypothetical protein